MGTGQNELGGKRGGLTQMMAGAGTGKMTENENSKIQQRQRHRSRRAQKTKTKTKTNQPNLSEKTFASVIVIKTQTHLTFSI